MEKQTVFFSHSSKDKDALIAFKNRICEITCDVINVFMSSDGESIPFGSNWVHKIDEGLKAAKIMFIFVTQNSILSNWIYFEAGYAYSRGINVIPVGLGVDISLLKPPLNLLQGFNVNSAESLNNFIAVINNELSTKFVESFFEKDFISLCSKIGFNNRVRIVDVFKEIEFSVYSKNGFDDVVDLIKLFNGLIDYFIDNNITYSISTANGRARLLSGGIMVEKLISSDYNDEFLKINISPFNLDASLYIIKNWLSVCYSRKKCYLWLYPNNDTNLLMDEVSISSIIHANLNTFSVIKETLNRYKYKSILFSISKNKYDKPMLIISYDIDDLSTGDVYELIDLLINIELITLK